MFEEILESAGLPEYRCGKCTGRRIRGSDPGEKAKNRARLGRHFVAAEVDQHRAVFSGCAFDRHRPAVHLVPDPLLEVARAVLQRQVGPDAFRE